MILKVLIIFWYQADSADSPPSLEWHPRTVRRTLGAKAGGKAISNGRYAVRCAGAIQGKEGKIQPLVPSPSFCCQGESAVRFCHS